MASQSRVDLPPDQEPVQPFTLPGDVLERKLENRKLLSLNVPVEQILGSKNLTFRHDVELPELSDNDSDTDEQPDTPPDVGPRTGTVYGWSTSAFLQTPSSQPSAQRRTFIGGAVVRNVCLVMPDQDRTGYTDLPVQPVRATPGQPTQLIAKILANKGEKPPLPLLILPGENKGTSSPRAEGVSGLEAFSVMDALAKSEKPAAFTTRNRSSFSAGKSDIIELSNKIEEEAEKEQVGKAEIENYVLSGDIDNFWGINGLTAKLYKYAVSVNPTELTTPKGPEKDAIDKDGKPIGDTDTKPGVERLIGEPGDEHKETNENKEDEEVDGPAREKIKFNTENLCFKGKPLGALFPFINGGNIRNLPVEKLELTYSEGKKNFLFQPGLRLELDVAFKDGLAWAGDALKNIFRLNKPPASIHLSALLSDTRDWSKAPKIEKLVLRGSFLPLKLEAWNFLNFKTLGVEITATKAAKEKDRSVDKKPGECDPVGHKANDKDSEDDHGTETKKAKISYSAALEKSTDEVADDPKKSDSEADESEEQTKDDKPKEEQSWYFGFGFFGTVVIAKIPYANAPLEMNYRIARDFVPPKDEKDEDDKKDDGKDKDKDEKPEESIEDDNSQEVAYNDRKPKPTAPIAKRVKKKAKGGSKAKKAKKVKQARKARQTKKAEKEKKNEMESLKHRRSWNLIIASEEWKDIYDIKNVTMTEAQLKASFDESDFRATAVLELSADLKLGDGTFKVKGQISRDGNFLESEVGDLSLTDIKKIHAQITGQKLPDDNKSTSSNEKTDKKEDDKKTAAGNDITFKELKLKLSSKKCKEAQTTRRALEFNGHVTFNEHSSATASLTFATEGLTIAGGISDFKIPNTEVTIKKAGLEIFFAFRSKKDSKKEDNKDREMDPRKEGDADGESTKNIDKTEDVTVQATDKKVEENKTLDETDNKSSTGTSTIKKKNKKVKRGSRFGVLGVVEINSITIKVGLYTEQKKDAKKREWLAFGAIENIRLREAWSDIPEDSFLNLQLENVALIASSEERKKKMKDEESDDKKDGKPDEDEDAAFKAVKSKTITNGVPDGERWISNIHGLKTANKESGDGGATGDKGAEEDKEEDNDEEDEEEEQEPDDWDVLGTADAYNYPIKKGNCAMDMITEIQAQVVTELTGIQLCATISSFQQLEELNGKKKIDGLKLIIAISPKGKISASIDLPESFQVRLSDHAYLGNFGTTIGLSSSGPELQLRATLTISFKDSDPICVEGVIVGTFKDVQGDLKMNEDSRWVNPFNLNKNIVFSRLGVSTGFTYATVLLIGPDRLALSGQVNIGKFEASLDMGLRMMTAEAVLQLKMNKLDVTEVFQLACTLIGNTELQQMRGAEDVVVFSDLKLYISSGAEFLGRFYDRGIEVRGKMRFFDVKGEFNGTFDESGVVIKAGLDNFKVGGLEIKSTQEGVDRATMDIEMTKDRQKFKIDGMIRYYEFEIKVFIDVDIQKRYLKADVRIQFCDDLFIELKASVSVPNPKSLEGVVMDFEGSLNPDILGAIIQAIDKVLNDLQNTLINPIREERQRLEREIAQAEASLKGMEEDFKKKEEKYRKEAMKQKAKISKEMKIYNRLRDKQKKSENEYNKAKEDKDKSKNEIERLERQRDEAKRQLEDKERAMRKEYDDKIARQRAKRAELEKEKKRLIDRRDARWGDELRSYEAAKKSWARWEYIEKERYKWREHCINESKNCLPCETPYWAYKVPEATIGLEEAHVHKIAEAEFLKAGREILNSKAFQFVGQAINCAAGEIVSVIQELEDLILQGMPNIARMMSEERKRIVDDYINKLDELIRKSEELEEVLIQAKKALDDSNGRLGPEFEESGERIAKLEFEMDTLPAKYALKAAERRYNLDRLTVDLQISNLRNKEVTIRAVMQFSRDILAALKKGVPRVTQILVRASTDVLAKNKPLVFEIQAEWFGKKGTFRIQWAPNQSPETLYREAAMRLAKWDVETQPIVEPVSGPKSLLDIPASKQILRLIHQGADDAADTWWSTYDGNSWQADQQVKVWGLKIIDGFCVTSYKGKLYLFHRNPLTTQSTAWYETFERGTWSKMVETCIPNTNTDWGMSAVTFKDKLWFFHHGVPYQKLRYNVFDGQSWESDKEVGIPDVNWGFTAVVFNEKIYVFHRMGELDLWYVVFNGNNWEESKQVPKTSTSWGMTAVVYHGKIYLMHHGWEGPNYVWYNVFNGRTWEGDKFIPDCDPEGELSSVVFNDKIYMFYKNMENLDIYSHVFDGDSWNIEKVEGVSTSKGVGCIVY
ncbi:hypothetical protein FSARC_338 [Fusarium sarcochroum]|uniref:Uncharacterized protein n=1 Tax=Fusarium sarcochroum TaxID=1208366 RepID=A0A8H4UBY6_9HYPO|nr:hypothetical protein FSARC_338 [Fusarium sarcochroum]